MHARLTQAVSNITRHITTSRAQLFFCGFTHLFVFGLHITVLYLMQLN